MTDRSCVCPRMVNMQSYLHAFPRELKKKNLFVSQTHLQSAPIFRTMSSWPGLSAKLDFNGRYLFAANFGLVLGLIRNVFGVVLFAWPVHVE